MKSVLSLFVASFFVIAGTANATPLNGGFETGDLTGWQILGDASVQTSSFGSGPTQGLYQAVLTNDWLAPLQSAQPPNSSFVTPLSGSHAALPSLLDPFLGLPSGSLQAITVGHNGVDVGFVHPGSAIAQTFSGAAGSLLSFNYNFLTSDGYNYDHSFVSLASSSLLFLEKLAGNDPSTLPGGTNYPPPLVASNTVFKNETGFKTFSFILPDTGTYTLGIGVVQVDDDIRDAGIIIDDVKVGSVPEPSSLLLLAVGLTGLFWWRRKQLAP